jgi:tetratricopeptide (TPR) repeat protein
MVFQTVAAKAKLTGDMLNDLGNCYFRKKDYPQAEEQYRRALEKSPRLSIAKKNLGITLGILRKSREAIELLDEYVKEDPSQTELYHVIADLWLSAENYPQALSNYECYLQKYPSDVIALFRLSDCYLHLGHKDSAILGYRRALQLDPGFAPAQRRLAELTATVNSGEFSPVSATKHKVT